MQGNVLYFQMFAAIFRPFVLLAMHAVYVINKRQIQEGKFGAIDPPPYHP